VNDPPRLPADAGLCGDCRNARPIETRRGSRFVLCDLSRTDPRFPRYPPLPVLRCAGFEARGGGPAPDPSRGA
jgi:hypothetical protein